MSKKLLYSLSWASQKKETGVSCKTAICAQGSSKCLNKRLNNFNKIQELFQGTSGFGSPLNQHKNSRFKSFKTALKLLLKTRTIWRQTYFAFTKTTYQNNNWPNRAKKLLFSLDISVSHIHSLYSMQFYYSERSMVLSALTLHIHGLQLISASASLKHQYSLINIYKSIRKKHSNISSLALTLVDAWPMLLTSAQSMLSLRTSLTNMLFRMAGFSKLKRYFKRVKTSRKFLALSNSANRRAN